MKLTKQIFGWLGATMLLLTGCNANENGYDTPQTREIFGTGKGRVTFTVTNESVAMGTRAGVDYTKKSISDGTKVDVLVFAVYTSDTKAGPYTLDETFQKPDHVNGPNGYTASKGQNVIKIFGDATTGNENTWPITITLATDPDKYYQVAFWAQNSTTKAFDASKLDAVKVQYNQISNNDELSDAFFVASTVFKGTSGQSQELMLRRPFAQVNVGTTGADLRNFMSNDNIYPNVRPLASKVDVEGVADCLNVLTGAATQSEGFNGKVTLNLATLPGYISNVTAIPDASNIEKLLQTEGEEFLKVKLNTNPSSRNLFDAYKNYFSVTIDNDGFLGYKTYYPTRVENDEVKNVDDAFLTETFKWMSMCYVLTPTSTASDGSGALVTKTNLAKFKLYMSENTTGGIAYLSVYNIPVQRNWRTNILGGLAWIKDPNTPDKPTEDPDDPDDPTPTPGDGPDDPTTIFNTVKICIHLDPLFNGEYNGLYGQTDEENPEQDTFWTDLNSGAFPGTADDEFKNGHTGF